MYIKLKLCVILLSVLFVASCSKKMSILPQFRSIDGRYDSQFPYNNCSNQLDEIGNTIGLITSIGYYQSYLFPEDCHATLTNINRNFIKENVIEETRFNNTASGTATAIYYENNRIALLTCAHIVKFPDKIIKYYKNTENTEKYIQTIAYLIDQSTFTTIIMGGGKLEVLIADEKIDIAIVGKKISTSDPLFSTFKYPLGKASKLEWGSFVYLFGFPRGYKMVTKGIVSKDKNSKNSSFFIDAPFNRGQSGGLVFAIKDGVPNFELVGISKSAAAEFEFFLSPTSSKFDSGENYDPYYPYKGDLYIQRSEKIMYGVTHVTSTESIKSFWKSNRDYLEQKGYYLSSFFLDK